MALKIRSRIPACIAACTLFVVLTGAAADTVGPRVRNFRELGAAYKNVSDQFRSSTPQVMLLQISARQIRSAAQAQYGWFPANSAPSSGQKTAAKAEIWSQPVQFKLAQDYFTTQANAFYKAAASGDVAAMRTQAKTLGEACSTCHRTFRQPS